MYYLPMHLQPVMIEMVKGGAGVSVSARPSISVTSRPSPVSIPRSPTPYTAPKPAYTQTIQPRTWTKPTINPMTNKPASETPIVLPRTFTYPQTQRTETYVRNPSVLPHPVFFLHHYNTNVVNNYQYDTAEQSQSSSDQSNSDFTDFIIFLGIVFIIGIIFLFITMN